MVNGNPISLRVRFSVSSEDLLRLRYLEIFGMKVGLLLYPPTAPEIY